VVKRLTLESGEPDHISIPDRGIETPIIYITQDKNNEEGHQEALAKGVVHFPGTAVPGEYGNPYIFGHSSDYFWKPGDYKQIFKPLIDIPLDTEIRITNHDGELFIYRIIETKIVGPKEVSVLDQYNYERKMLTLQTSWPLNTALKRYLAIAELDEEATYGTAN
jgi:sortase A